MKRFRILFMTILFIFFAVDAMALTTYSDRAIWSSNVLGIVTEDFNALQSNEYEKLTLGPVTFDVPGYINSDDIWISSVGSYAPIGIALVGNHPMTTVLATFNPQTTAVGANVANLSVDDTIQIIVLEDGNPFTFDIAYTYPTPFFFGVTSTKSINSISFSPTTSAWVGIDDFSYGTTTGTPQVPEPTTMLLLGLGLIGIAGIRKKMS